MLRSAKKWLAVLLAGAFVLSLPGAAWSVGPGSGKPGKKPSRVSVTGIVNKVLDQDGKLSGVRLQSEDGVTYQLILDKRTRKLAKSHDEERVEVTAEKIKKKTEEGLQVWLKVLAYKPSPDESPLEE